MTNESTLSLAARLAANLFVDAIKLAKPGARLAAKVGDRLLGGSPFNEREAQRFLAMGGPEGKCGVCGSFGYCYMPDRCPKAAEQLADAEAERDVYEPDPLWSAENRRQEFNTLPNWQAHTSAPGRPKPPVDAESPEVADPPSEATSGHPCAACDYTDNGWCACECHESSAPVAHSPEPVAADAPSPFRTPSGGDSGQPTSRKHPWSDADPKGPNVVVAAGMTDMFLQLDDLGRTDVRVQCAHCRRIIPSPSVFAVHLLTCDMKIADPLDAPAQETSDSPGEQPVSAGVVTGPCADGSLGRAEHPLYREIQEQADAAIVADVIAAHQMRVGMAGGIYCLCDDSELGSAVAWRAHVAPLIIAELQQ